MKILNRFLISILTCFLFVVSIGAEEPLIEEVQESLVYNTEEGTDENPENVVEGTTEGVVEGDGETVIDSSESTSEGIASTENEAETQPEENSSVESLPELATFEKEIVYNEEHTIATVILTYTGQCTELNIANADEIQEFVNIGVYRANMEKGDWETSIAFDILLNGMVYFEINVWNNDDLIGTVPVRCSITGLNNDQLIFDPNQEPTTYTTVSSDVGVSDSQSIEISYVTNVSYTWSIPTSLELSDIEGSLPITINNSNLAPETALRVKINTTNDFNLVNSAVNDDLSYIVTDSSGKRIHDGDIILDHLFNMETSTNTLNIDITRMPVYSGEYNDTWMFTTSVERLLSDLYSGQVVAINNLGTTHNLTDLKIYSTGYQKSGNGKNLLNNSQYEPSVFNGNSYYNGYGNEKWNSEEFTLSSLGNVGESVTYQVYIDATKSTSDMPNMARAWINKCDGSSISIDGNKILSNTKGVSRLTIDLTEDIESVIFGVFISYNGTTVVTNAMVEKGSTATTYEPYLGGVPTPTPENPSSFMGVVNPTININNKNMIDVPDFSNKYVDDIGYFNYQLRDGTRNTNIVVNWIKNNGRSFITFSPRENITALWLRHSGTSKDFTIFNTNVNLKANTTYTLSFDVDGYNPAEIGSLNLHNFQLEEGEKMTEYTPFQNNYATLECNLKAIPTSEGGNIVVENQEYIADYVDVENKKIIRMVGEYILDGINNQFEYLYANTANGTVVYDSNGLFNHYDSLVCDKMFYEKENYNNMKLYSFGGTSGDSATIWFVLPAEISTLEEANEWLISNPFTIYYPLKEPIEIPLLDSQIENIKNLFTYTPATFVSASSEQLKPYIQFRLS